MRAHLLLVLSILCVSTFLAVRLQAQHNPSDAPSAESAQTQGNDHVVEGTVVSTTSHTLVVRSDDNKYHLFTYDAAHTVPNETVKPGARVRVNGGAPDETGAQVAENVTVIQPASDAAQSEPGAQAAPPPPAMNAAVPPSPQVNQTSKQIEAEARKWHVGGKIGFGFSPEVFMFGPQAQFGPFFSEHLLFRPNVEFGFGELTSMFGVNGEMAYRFNAPIHGQWTPYLGMGPSFNFVNQSASSGNTSFSNFNYKTGFNIFVGGQKNKTFFEVKTALWSGKAPVLRLFVGYNF
jgi:hypothetical protein